MSDHSPAAAKPHDDHGFAHVMPVPVLLGVFFALCFLTIVTVGIAKIPTEVIDLSAFNIWIAMGIATIKAFLVMAFFMHLRYDKLLNIIVFGGSFLFVFLFLGVAMIDTHQYKNNVDTFRNNQPGLKPEPGPSLPPPQEGVPATPAAPAAPAAAPAGEPKAPAAH